MRSFINRAWGMMKHSSPGLTFSKLQEVVWSSAAFKVWLGQASGSHHNDITGVITVLIAGGATVRNQKAGRNF